MKSGDCGEEANVTFLKNKETNKKLTAAVCLPTDDEIPTYMLNYVEPERTAKHEWIDNKRNTAIFRAALNALKMYLASQGHDVSSDSYVTDFGNDFNYKLMMEKESRLSEEYSEKELSNDEFVEHANKLMNGDK